MALQRLTQGAALAADVGACAGVEVDAVREAGAQDVIAQIALLLTLLDGGEELGPQVGAVCGKYLKFPEK